MPFVRQRADPEFLELMRANAQWMAYGGDWAIDPETGDFLHFAGCDVLDPTVPSLYGLVTDRRERTWGVETLEGQYVPADFLAQLASPDNPPRLLVVLRHGRRGAAPADIQAKALEGLAALLGKRPSEMAVVTDWSAVGEAQAAARSSLADRRPVGWGTASLSPQKVPLRTLLRELRPVGWMALFAIIVLIMAANGK